MLDGWFVTLHKIRIGDALMRSRQQPCTVASGRAA
jgi:hypothetical protein